MKAEANPAGLFTSSPEVTCPVVLEKGKLMGTLNAAAGVVPPSHNPKKE